MSDRRSQGCLHQATSWLLVAEEGCQGRGGVGMEGSEGGGGPGEDLDMCAWSTAFCAHSGVEIGATGSPFAANFWSPNFEHVFP